MDPKKRGLGRGLNALFEDDEDFAAVAEDGEESSDHGIARRRESLGVDQLSPGPGQPRRNFNDDSLKELSDSIRQHGVLQPLLVRARDDEDGQYHIIAGERRWRAAQKAQLHEVPAIILAISDREAFEIALIENLQREDLDPIDEATGYKRLIDEHEYTQEELATGLGKSRSHIANMMRLLQLPEAVQSSLSIGDITIGHARALITADNALELVKKVVANGLSVRDTERLIAEMKGSSPKKKPKHKKPAPVVKDVDTIALEDDLSQKVGMRVSIDSTDGKTGHLNVEFKSLDQLDELIQKLSTQGQAMRLSD